MNAMKNYKDGQHERMWQRIRAIRWEAAERRDFFTADFLELLEAVASGEKVTVTLDRIMARMKPAVESIDFSVR